MRTLFRWIRWAVFIAPYTICWWLTFVLGWLLYGSERRDEPMTTETASLEAYLRTVPLRMRVLPKSFESGAIDFAIGWGTTPSANIKIACRDEFAMAALTGLLANSDTVPLGYSDWAVEAYNLADAMMQEKHRRDGKG